MPTFWHQPSISLAENRKHVYYIASSDEMSKKKRRGYKPHQRSTTEAGSKKNGEVKKPRQREKYNVTRILALLERNLVRFCLLKQTPNNL